MKNKKLLAFITLISILFLFYRTNDQKKVTQAEFKWVKKAGDRYYDHGHSIITDQKDHIYVTGFLEGRAPSENRGYDIFIAKYDNQGNLIWTKKAGGKNFDEGLSIAADKEDNIYITGYFKESATFESTLISAFGDRDIFIAKYNTLGELFWVKQAGGKGKDVGYSLATDNMNNILVTGSFSGKANFGNKSITSKGNSDIFIAKYSNKGKLLWLKQAGSPSFDHGFSIATDELNNFFITGYFKETASFGEISITSRGDRDIFLAKYDSKGELLWVKQGGGRYWDYGYSVATDLQNNVYITGFFFENALFGDVPLTASDQNDVFIAKYNQKGKLLWIRQAGGSSYDRGKSISTDKMGNVYIAGHFKSNTTFADVTLTAYGHYDIFITKYDSKGTFKWIKQAGGPFYDEGSSVTIGVDNSIYLTGSFTSSRRRSAQFGEISLRSEFFDIFIAKIADK